MKKALLFVVGVCLTLMTFANDSKPEPSPSLDCGIELVKLDSYSGSYRYDVYVKDKREYQFTISYYEGYDGATMYHVTNYKEIATGKEYRLDKTARSKEDCISNFIHTVYSTQCSYSFK